MTQTINIFYAQCARCGKKYWDTVSAREAYIDVCKNPECKSLTGIILGPELQPYADKMIDYVTNEPPLDIDPDYLDAEDNILDDF